MFRFELPLSNPIEVGGVKTLPVVTLGERE